MGIAHTSSLSPPEPIGPAATMRQRCQKKHQDVNGFRLLCQKRAVVAERNNRFSRTTGRVTHCCDNRDHTNLYDVRRKRGKTDAR